MPVLYNNNKIKKTICFKFVYMDRLNNGKYKRFLIILKTIPVVLSFMCFLEIIFTYVKIECEILHIISFTSILPLIFLYSASYVFKFCEYHRMFLHYISFVTLYEIVDLYFNIPFKEASIFALLMIITFIFMVIILYKYMKDKKGGVLWQ